MLHPALSPDISRIDFTQIVMKYPIYTRIKSLFIAFFNRLKIVLNAKRSSVPAFFSLLLIFPVRLHFASKAIRLVLLVFGAFLIPPQFQGGGLGIWIKNETDH